MNLLFLLIAIPLGASAGYAWYWDRSRRRVVNRLDHTRTSAAELVERAPLALAVSVFPRRNRWIAPTAGAIVGLALGLAGGVAIEISAAAGLLAAVLGYLVEETLASRQTGRIEAQLATAIDLLVASLRAGSAISIAFDLAQHETKPPLRPYLREIVGRMRLGEEPRAVIGALADHVPLDTFRLFAQSLTAHWEVGGSLATTLATVGRTIRDRVELSRRTRTQTVEANLSVAAIMALSYLLGFLMWRANPERMVAFLTSGTGSRVVALVIALQAVGLLWMSRIARSKL
jgi:Flp pilus assembly protein TadB